MAPSAKDAAVSIRAMAVRVRLASAGSLTVMSSKQDEEVADEVGERVQSVGDQALRVGNDAGDDLRDPVRRMLTRTLTQVTRWVMACRVQGRRKKSRGPRYGCPWLAHLPNHQLPAFYRGRSAIMTRGLLPPAAARPDQPAPTPDRAGQASSDKQLKPGLSLKFPATPTSNRTAGSAGGGPGTASG
jgi:hypothetical protein